MNCILFPVHLLQYATLDTTGSINIPQCNTAIDNHVGVTTWEMVQMWYRFIQMVRVFDWFWKYLQNKDHLVFIFQKTRHLVSVWLEYNDNKQEAKTGAQFYHIVWRKDVSNVIVLLYSRLSTCFDNLIYIFICNRGFILKSGSNMVTNNKCTFHKPENRIMYYHIFIVPELSVFSVELCF